MNTKNLLEVGRPTRTRQLQVDRAASFPQSVRIPTSSMAGFIALLGSTIGAGNAYATECDLTFAEALVIVEGSVSSSPDPQIDVNVDAVVSHADLEMFLSDACVLAAIGSNE